MSSHNFSFAEKYAVFTVHNEKCWLCNEPVGLLETEIDHIIPEALIGDAALQAVLIELGLPADFDVNSFANWMPAHPHCNRYKSSRLFRPTPLIQLRLQSALDKEARAINLHDNHVSDKKISRAINMLLSAHQIGGFAYRHTKMIRHLVDTVEQEHESNREHEDRRKPLLLAPWLEIIYQDVRWITLRGAGGMIGVRPTAGDLHSSWDCPNCGPTGWSGARCVICGMFDDGD